MKALSPSSLARERCVSCGFQGKLTREHFWPQWLIQRTGTAATGVKWKTGKKINPMSATLPLCYNCNQQFGRELESPVSRIFEELENGRGLADNEAELLIRWLWKLEGLAWLAENPKANYSPAFSLKERVLNKLGAIRGSLSLAVSIIHHIDPKHGDAPMGIDSTNDRNAIFVSGVFSKLSLMCLLSDARHLVPANFSVYPLRAAEDSYGKLFFPKTGFNDDNEAVGVTKIASRSLDWFHEKIAGRG
jgi:hypothetical protein